MSGFEPKFSMQPSIFGGDFNGDGKADIIDFTIVGLAVDNFAEGYGYITDFVDLSIDSLDGNKVIESSRTSGEISDSIRVAGWQAQAVGDFNNDGKSDIIFRNFKTGQNLVWNMDGVDFVGDSTIGRAVPDPNWEIVGAGDFNNDGKDDLLLRNAEADQNLLWYMNDSQIQSEGLLGRALGSDNWQISGVADFNQDGQEDIVLRHQSPDGLGQNIVWFMDGNEIIGEAVIGREVPDVNWEIIGAGDSTGDGKADLILWNKSSGQQLLWGMDGTSIVNERLVEVFKGDPLT